MTGYRPNYFGKCVIDCQIPCATCEDDKPNKCTSCFIGSYLSEYTCKFDLSCNNYNNCTDCGVGTGYTLAGANCLACNKIKNCLQCSQTNNQICALCTIGFYLNNSKCSVCPYECFSCISLNTCTSCRIGYTLPQDLNQGICRAC